MHENEAKEQMREHKGELLDSFEVSAGTPAKGSQVKLKTYFNATDIDEAQVKVQNLLKIRQYLMDKKILM